MELVLLTALGVGGATVFGALIGFLFKKQSHAFSDITLSFAAGIMLAAAVLGLILPSLEEGGKWGLLVTVAGIFAGALCLSLVDKLVPHLHKLAGVDTETHAKSDVSHIMLFVFAIAIHNLPEGIAAGVGFGAGNSAQALLIAGGIFYTVGVIFYAIKKVRYFHSIWHIFTLFGSLCHYFCILFAAMGH